MVDSSEPDVQFLPLGNKAHPVSRNVLMLVHQCYQGIRPFSLIGDYPGQIGDHHQGVVDPAVFGRVEDFSRFTERPESRWHLHLCNEDPIPQAFVVGAEIPDRSQVAQHGLKDPFIDLIVTGYVPSYFSLRVPVPPGQLPQGHHLDNCPYGATAEIVAMCGLAMLLVLLLQPCQIGRVALGEQVGVQVCELAASLGVGQVVGPLGSNRDLDAVEGFQK